MKIAFMGTPEFAVPSLKKIDEYFGVKCVFTQPDRPKGRGKKLSMSPVKEYALSKDIKVLQPKSIKKDRAAIEYLKELDLDLIIVVAYGQILSKEILDIPRLGCVNLHASLLPKYRGAAPINWSIIEGEKESGNTTMLMDVGLDTGDMLLSSKVEITENMSAGELHDILMIDGAELLIKTIKELADHSIIPTKQEENFASYSQMLNKDMAKINWNESGYKIKDFVRGLNPWPVSYTIYKNNVLKIYEVEFTNKTSEYAPGHIIDATKEGIMVSVSDGVIIIKKFQFPGKKVLTAEEYLRGNNIETGILLS